jgi:hypothetical protein
MFSTDDWRAAGETQVDDAGRVLGSVFGTAPGRGSVISRSPWPFEGTFDAEVVTCRTSTGDVRRVYCKHGPTIEGTRHAAYGHRGGLAREAAVYSYVLEPLGVSAARCIGFRHDDLTDADWLVLEYLEGATPLLESRRSRSLDRAAAWLGSFHGATEGLWPDLLLSGIPFRDADWYQGWMDRTAGWAGALHLRYPWLAAACRREGLYEPLLTAPHSVVHGEFTAANVLLRDGDVYPVDWESAALAPGEVDLAFFTLGWPGRLRRRVESAYVRRRWPGGPPATFEAALRAARIHACFRVLGDSPMGPSAADARTIFKMLQALL